MKPKKMTNEQISEYIAEKYGDDFELDDLDVSDPIVAEFFERLGTGVHKCGTGEN